MDKIQGFFHKFKDMPKKEVRIAASVIMGLLTILLFSTAAAAGKDNTAQVTVRVNDITILQGEEIPALTLTAKVSGKTDTVLDEKSGYTAKDLIEDLNEGKDYKLTCNTDGVTEGEYPIHLEYSKKFHEAVEKKWFGKVRINTLDGTLTVANKYGEWDGDKFKAWDGTYVTNSFIPVKGKTYYFGEDGVKVSGWQSINNHTYYFDKAGVMQTGWQERDGEKYYLKEDGSAQIGWLTLDKDKYYFNAEGKMVTGNQRIGIEDCVFKEDGKLKSSSTNIDANKPMVALTFDDGPGERTDELLEVLKQYNAHATFFMLGKRAVNQPDTIKKMEAYGCELGNHSKTHAQLTKLDAAGIQAEIGDTNNAVANAVGHGASVMRPPYGAVNQAVHDNAHMPLIMWSIDTLDWKTKNAQATIDTVMNTVKDGDIILMHDIHSTSVDAAIVLIPKLIDAGYQLVTVNELAGARGITLENGKKYFSFYK